MIVLGCEQGSAEWVAARLGCATASQFHRLVTKTGRPSSSRDRYLCELVAESLLHSPLESAGSPWTDRGTDLEDEARRWYELTRDVDVGRVGFVRRSDVAVGCSPDGLVGDGGLLEVKCLSALRHVAALCGMLEDEHRPQIQGMLWVTRRKWCDLLHYNPAIAPAVVRYARDEEYIDALRSVVMPFAARVAEELARIKAMDPAEGIEDPDARAAAEVFGW